ncbi:ABC transporter ATP-binding protein, partial [Paenibacillus sp. 28ISP30-2]|nr:ABC transporter ATP-binding protein [Paenibacillus sp. 28ISP30-2]
MTTKLLEVKHLKTYFKTEDGIVPSVNGVSFTVNPGETLAIVGESGSGKSVTSLSIMGLVAAPGKVVGGEILLEGRDLLKLSRGEMRKYRGNEVSMIFQEPMSSLNPVFTIGNQISEVIRQHQKLSKSVARRKSIEILVRVGIPGASKVVSYFPPPVSGGTGSRVMIAMVVACHPKLRSEVPTTDIQSRLGIRYDG